MTSALTHDDLLATLPAERADAIRAWLSTPLNTCRSCQQPVLPHQPRRIDKDADGHSMHLDCT